LILSLEERVDIHVLHVNFARKVCRKENRICKKTVTSVPSEYTHHNGRGGRPESHVAVCV
jgi:endonuclease III